MLGMNSFVKDADYAWRSQSTSATPATFLSTSARLRQAKPTCSANDMAGSALPRIIRKAKSGHALRRLGESDPARLVRMEKPS